MGAQKVMQRIGEYELFKIDEYDNNITTHDIKHRSAPYLGDDE